MRNLICRWAIVSRHYLWSFSTSSLLIAFASIGSPGWAQSALEPVQVEREGSWLGGLYMNQNSGRFLCAMETRLTDGSVFRINYYGLRNTFLEVTTGERIAHGSFQTELLFLSDNRPSLLLPAFVEKDFIIVEMTNDAVAGELVQIIARAHTLTVMNRGTALFDVPVNGSARALELMGVCARTLHRN